MDHQHRDLSEEGSGRLPGLLWRGVGVAAAACALVAMLALECDIYGALAAGRSMRWDGEAFRALLVSVGVDASQSSP